MQTSNFSRSGSDPKAVAISRSQPRGWTGRIFEPLAPSWRLVQKAKGGTIDDDEYARLYREEVLSKLDPGEVYADLGDDAILLCWERPGDFCHRRLVAEWFEERLGVSVPELGAGGARQARLGEWCTSSGWRTHDVPKAAQSQSSPSGQRRGWRPSFFPSQRR